MFTARLNAAFLAALMLTSSPMAIAQEQPHSAAGNCKSDISVTLRGDGNTVKVIVVPNPACATPTPYVGWVYIGKYRDGWSNGRPNVVPIDGDRDIPAVGDIVETKTDVNVRAAPYYYDVDSSKNVKPAVKGIARTGRRLVVLAVHDARFPKGIVWAQVRWEGELANAD